MRRPKRKNVTVKQSAMQRRMVGDRTHANADVRRATIEAELRDFLAGGGSIAKLKSHYQPD